MTNRERFRRIMNFEPVDRLLMIEWATWWDKTIAAWKQQGLEIEPCAGMSEGEALQRQFGLDLHQQCWIRMLTDLTPKHAGHGAPVISSEEDYERILPTLYPRDIDLSAFRRFLPRYESGEAITWLTLDGFFWGARQLLGIEPHLYAFYDKPGLLHRINRDIAEFSLRVIDAVCSVLTPDFMTIAEDMSYNNGPMLSEEMFNEFMLPYYDIVVPELKRRGIRVFIDSDGDITRALPWFERAGIEGILPLERQAGVDLEQLRREHPRTLFIGHFDKMTMPRGEAAMRAEFERLTPVMRQGGFLPSVDHQTPPGVTLDNYRIYLRLLREYAEKAHC